MQNQPLSQHPTWQTLASFSLPIQPGSESMVGKQVAATVHPLKLPSVFLERFISAAVQATLDVIEHSHRYRPDLPITIRVLVSNKARTLHVTDADNETIPSATGPDSPAVTSGPESSQGWSFFLIERTVDDPQPSDDEPQILIELFLYPEGTEEEPG